MKPIRPIILLIASAGMAVAQEITVIDADFRGRCWQGFEGEIRETPFYPICRTQLEIGIRGDWERLREEILAAVATGGVDRPISDRGRCFAAGPAGCARRWRSRASRVRAW